ncbi:stage II sporulation protein P [Tuberibacillus calidus]|uniref:stage II sporulation protein P n=1 Tax=Tuberibacillus calidus TaxID=340097 RepID=UPI000427B242|nr:stage II sporulation protein P [Tuberibacillus calidus]
MLPYPHRRNTFTFRVFSGIPFLLLSLFIAAAVMTTPLFQSLLSFGNVEKALSGLKSESLLEMIGWQNPYFESVLPHDYNKISFTESAFRTVTHISFTDERSLLGNELPGFSIFDSDIIVAGSGTNYTNLPIDTPPPLEYILKNDPNDSEESEPAPKSPPPTDAKVFIYSTHSWESYLPLVGKSGAGDANLATSNNANSNIYVVDNMLKDALGTNGVAAVVNNTNITNILHEKNWNTNKAYSASRPLVQAAIASKNDYQLFIDIHRDSSRKPNTTTTIHGKSYARVAFVIGKENPHSGKNETIAKKLFKQLDEKYPGIGRGVIEKSWAEGNGIYNQDLSPHVILIEVGGVDNTMEELQRTVKALAEIIAEYVKNAEAV